MVRRNAGPYRGVRLGADARVFRGRHRRGGRQAARRPHERPWTPFRADAICRGKRLEDRVEPQQHRQRPGGLQDQRRPGPLRGLEGQGGQDVVARPRRSAQRPHEGRHHFLLRGPGRQRFKILANAVGGFFQSAKFPKPPYGPSRRVGVCVPGKTEI